MRPWMIKKNIDKTVEHVNTISENIERVEIMICFTQEMHKAQLLREP